MIANLRNKLATLSFLMMATCSVATRAQTATPQAPNAPLPSALATATKIFIGNAGDQENADCLRVYSDFYQDISALGRYQLVLDPNAADLVLELHYEIAVGQSIVSSHNADAVRQFRIVIQDPHSHIVLWSLTERTNYAIRQGNRDKNLDETVAKLASDFSALASETPVPPNNKSIIKH